MQTVLANGAVVAWVVSLIYAPVILLSTFRRCGPLAVAAGGMVTMVVAAFITSTLSLTGHSPVPELRILSVLLAVTLVAAAARGVMVMLSRRRTPPGTHRPPRRHGSTALVVMSTGLLGIWVLLPMLVVLHRQGLDFGLLSLGNADESNYVLAAQNMAGSGFRDSHHLANVDMGRLSQDNYVGAILMLILMSTMTTLTPLQVALAAMAVAIVLTAAGLWALANQIWPALSPALGLPCVIVASGSGLALYGFSQYFLGSVVGVAAVATTLAGLIALSRGWSWPGAVAVVAGGGYGIYGYGHLVLPLLVVAPVLAIAVAAVLSGVRAVPRAVARIAACSLVAVLFGLPALRTAYGLMRAQSTVTAGWMIPPLSPIQAIFWPQSIGLASSGTALVAGWTVVGVVVVVALVAAGWRQDARRSAVLAGLVVLGVAVVVVGTAQVYGGDTYQSWKMFQFLLPMGLAAALPAVGLLTVRAAKIGPGLLNGAAGIALVGPWVLWSPVIASANPDLVSTHDLVASAHATQDMDVSAINVRLASSNQALMVGALFDKTVVVLSQEAYYAPMASTKTCTLTMRSMLAPHETDFVALKGDYVLLQRPARCLTGR